MVLILATFIVTTLVYGVMAVLGAGWLVRHLKRNTDGLKNVADFILGRMLSRRAGYEEKAENGKPEPTNACYHPPE
jgi:hypothetical protein